MERTRRLDPPSKKGPFAIPLGWLGGLAGWLMSQLSKENNAWAVSHLEVAAADHILEIGFGPGVGIQLIAAKATRGQVTGIDPSPVMVRQAARRNLAGVEAGQIDLHEGGLPTLPFGHGRFDKVLSVNNFMLWPGPSESLQEIRRVMKPGGRLVITLNPKWSKSFDDTQQMAREIAGDLTAAGFVDLRTSFRSDLKPHGSVTIVAFATAP